MPLQILPFGTKQLNLMATNVSSYILVCHCHCRVIHRKAGYFEIYKSKRVMNGIKLSKLAKN